MNQAVFDLFNSLIANKHRDPLAQIRDHAPKLNIAGLDLVFTRAGVVGDYCYIFEDTSVYNVPNSEVRSGVELLRISIHVLPELDHFKVNMAEKTYRAEYGLVKYDEQRRLFVNVSSIEKAVAAVEDFLKRGFKEDTIL